MCGNQGRGGGPNELTTGERLGHEGRVEWRATGRFMSWR
jgi:hypothetical protein